MPYFFTFWWSEESEDHVAQHGVTKEEFEYVVNNALSRDVDESRSSGLPAVYGYTATGRYLFCVYAEEDGCCIPVTAYEV